MSHTALARKYRPKSFADVATQQHVSETLRKAVATDRVGHAYLFCGPRGVGKTTLARVLAMALNCPNRAPEGEPCGECDTCSRIWGGLTALDVVEIDAASNRGVDDARDLRERAMYAPSSDGATKVYIVDEAHMLTREAWNALLKILEEPPPRVIFVFATTEPQKIQQAAAPIMSRCQRFDFRRIGIADITARLTSVLSQEGVDAPEEDALRLIARKADGGMRDALSVLDQVLSLTGGSIDVESVRRVLGLVEDERYLEVIDILRDRRHGDVFRIIQELVDEGYDLVEFYHGLLDIFRAMLRLRLAPDAEVDVHEDVRPQLLERASAFEPGDLVRMLSAAADLESQGSLRRSPNPRLPIEMLLLRMSFLDRTVAIEELIRALGGLPSPPSGAGGGKVETGPRGSSTPNVRPPIVGASDREAEAGEEGTSGGGAAVPQGVRADSSEGKGEPIAALSGSALEAWSRWLEDGKTVPRGLGAFLRSADVRESEDGALTVTPLPGPAEERLGRATVLNDIKSGVSRFLGRRPDLVIARSGSEPADRHRVTEGEVREDTLKALYRQEPRLERAVEELDLELME